jgi:hypothetical protein
MTTESQFPNETTHPETGARMVLDTSQGVDAARHRLERNIGIQSGGAEALAKIREKEQNEGRIYVDPVTGYRARLNPGGAKKPAASSASSASSGTARP